MRAADDRLNASIMMHSSTRCSSTGGDVGCMMKTSVPRMFSSIWNADFRIGKPVQPCLPEGDAEELGDLLRELRVRASSEDLQFGPVHT